MSTQVTTISALKQPDQAKQYQVSLTDVQGFELAQRAAKALAKSTLVPKEYRGGEEGIANCLVALNMANRIGADPLMVMQNLIVIHGKPTWSAQFLIATVNTSGRFTALRFEFFGEPNTDSWGCRAWAIEKSTNEKLVGTDITIALAKKEGWYGKNGSKWQTMPQQMLMYRAGSWWARAYAPELSMGLHTAEEIRDIIDINPDGSYTITSEELREIREIDGSDAASDKPKTDQSTGEVEMTFAQVNDLLVKSKTLDELDIAAGYIESVADEQHRKELNDVYANWKSKMKG